MNFAKSRELFNYSGMDLPGQMNLGHGNAAGLGGFGGIYGANMKTGAYSNLSSINFS